MTHCRISDIARAAAICMNPAVTVNTPMPSLSSGADVQNGSDGPRPPMPVKNLCSGGLRPPMPVMKPKFPTRPPLDRLSGLACRPAAILAILLFANCAETGGGGAGGAGGQLGDLPPGDNGTGGISDIPNPTAEMARRGGKSLTRIQRGHEVFMLKCGECHYYMMPEKVDLMDWEDTMPEMIRHAGLGRAEEQAVLDYVVAVRATHGLTD